LHETKGGQTFGKVAQELLHTPQFRDEVLRFTSQPLVTLPSQSSKKGRQETMAHFEFEHEVRLTLGNREQLFRHDPQFAFEELILISQPFPKFKSQSAVPVEQAATSHIP